jgi:hypothetical protein
MKIFPTYNILHSEKKYIILFLLLLPVGITVLSSTLFNKYKLNEAGLHTGVRHNRESITGMLYILPSLSVGSFIKQNVIIGSYDALQNCDGLLSMDYFRDTPLRLILYIRN